MTDDDRASAAAPPEPWGGPPVMETERLLLRPYRREDVATYAAISADPEVMRYLGGPKDSAYTEEQMAGSNDDLRRTGAGMVAVERRADGQFLGGVDHIRLKRDLMSNVFTVLDLFDLPGPKCHVCLLTTVTV